MRFPNVTTSQIRLNIKDSKACSVISNIEIYKAQRVFIERQIMRNKNGEVTIFLNKGPKKLWRFVSGNVLRRAS